jgi:hypothetical protein
MSSEDPPALSCVPGAIPAAQLGAHFELLNLLFTECALDRRALPDGYAYRFTEDTWADLARWIGNERRCCPFLRFAVELSPERGDIELRLTGPAGVHAFLDAELPMTR